MATEAAWLKGKKSLSGKSKTTLTVTGLLMEGLQGRYFLPVGSPS
jgi:hypothetical protein